MTPAERTAKLDAAEAELRRLQAHYDAKARRRRPVGRRGAPARAPAPAPAPAAVPVAVPANIQVRIEADANGPAVIVDVPDACPAVLVRIDRDTLLRALNSCRRVLTVERDARGQLVRSVESFEA